MAELTNPEPLSREVQEEFEAIRSAASLRGLTTEEDGTGNEQLPAGVYGFTYSPFASNFPFFKDRDLRSYESHKLKDGSVKVLGFLTADEKKLFESATAVSTLHLFPEPKGEAHHLVQIPLDRVQKHAENSQRGGTGLLIEVAPKS